MTKHSQDLANQSETLKHQIQAQEQELLTLQTSTKTAKSQWADQKKQIAEDTKVAINASKEAIKDALALAKEELKFTETTRHIAKGELEIHIKKSAKITADLSTEIDKLERQKKVVQDTNNTLRGDNTALKSEIKIGRQELADLTEQKNGLWEIIAELTDSKDQLYEDIDKATLDLALVHKKLIDLEQEFESRKAEHDKEISMLELKKQDLSQEIIETRANDDKVRENLAAWQHKLDEQDKSLRIREAKAFEQEQAIIRNYNLLNL